MTVAHSRLQHNNTDALFKGLCYAWCVLASALFMGVQKENSITNTSKSGKLLGSRLRQSMDGQAARGGYSAHCAAKAEALGVGGPGTRLWARVIF